MLKNKKPEKKKSQEIVKKYSFTKMEVNVMSDIELGININRQVMSGLVTNQQLLMQQVFERLGFKDGAPTNYKRNVTYSINKAEIVVTDTPMTKEEIEAQAAAKKAEEALAKK